jgi:hypothetical protein
MMSRVAKAGRLILILLVAVAVTLLGARASHFPDGSPIRALAYLCASRASCI